MSGGSMCYVYATLESEAVGRMGDAELDELMRDVAALLHDCEWWHSGDTCEETYRKTVAKFKRKWFGKTRSARLERLIDERIANARKECLQMIGVEVQHESSDPVGDESHRRRTKNECC